MRKEKKVRETKETKVDLSLNLDGDGRCNIKTGIPFFDHLLSLFSHHSMFDLEIEARGDLPHHIIEDIGICLGETLDKALGDKKEITRYGDIILPMDETLAMVSLDISGRPNLFITNLVSNKVFAEDKVLITNLANNKVLHEGKVLIKKDNLPFEFSGIVDGFDASLLQAFFKAFVDNSKITLHIVILYGTDFHHIIEAIFKALGRVLKEAVKKEREGIPSSKGVI